MKVIKATILALFLLIGSAQLAQAQSQVLPLGADMPTGSNLTALDGSTTSLSALSGSAGTVVVFWSNQCTWVDRYENRFMDLHNTFSGQGVRFVAINANDASAFPEESLNAMRQRAENRGYGFRYVRDNQRAAVARSFGAARTPHVFLFDANDTLVYVGTIDDSPGDEGNVENRYLRNALNAIVEGADVDVAQTKAFGCTIKLPN